MYYLVEPGNQAANDELIYIGEACDNSDLPSQCLPNPVVFPVRDTDLTEVRIKLTRYIILQCSTCYNVLLTALCIAHLAGRCRNRFW